MKIKTIKFLLYAITLFSLFILYGVSHSWNLEKIGSEKILFIIKPVDFFHFGLLLLGILYLAQKSLIDYTFFQQKDFGKRAFFITIFISTVLFAFGLIGIWFVDLARALELCNWTSHYGFVTEQIVQFSTKDVFIMGGTFQAFAVLLQTLVFVIVNKWKEN